MLDSEMAIGFLGQRAEDAAYCLDAVSNDICRCGMPFLGRDWKMMVEAIVGALSQLELVAVLRGRWTPLAVRKLKGSRPTTLRAKLYHQYRNNTVYCEREEDCWSI